MSDQAPSLRLRLTAVFFPALLVAISFLPACNKLFSPDTVLIQVDMSKEHDAGRFKSESGDRISIAGNFANWTRDSLSLTDDDKDWIYTLSLPKALLADKDTVEFKFAQLAGDGREIANSGWETISNRKVAVTSLIAQTNAFVFNESYQPKEFQEQEISRGSENRDTKNSGAPNEAKTAKPLESVTISFTVGMNNQKVLDFFKPELGDKVLVSGNFNGWAEQGLEMSDADNDGIYAVVATGKVPQDEPVQYKFKIVPAPERTIKSSVRIASNTAKELSKKRVFINDGWETGANRVLERTANTLEASYVEFSDLRRVARFTVNVENWIKVGKFNAKKGDVVQIKLILDGKETLSDVMIEVKPRLWEAAMMIPLTVQGIKWGVVKNISTVLAEAEPVAVGLEGKHITNFYKKQ